MSTRAAVERLRRIRREGVERQNRLNPIVGMWFAPRVRKSNHPPPAAAPTRASKRKRKEVPDYNKLSRKD